MKNDVEKLVELMKENPDLPVYAWVSADDSMEEGLVYPAQIKNPEVRRYCQVEPYGWYDTSWVFQDEPEDYIEYLIETEDYEGLSDEEAEKKAEEEMKKLPWKTAIFFDAPVI